MAEAAQPFERKLAAIFAADVAGYSRLMGQDEVETMRTLTAYREVMDRLIAQHRGRMPPTLDEGYSLQTAASGGDPRVLGTF